MDIFNSYVRQFSVYYFLIVFPDFLSAGLLIVVGAVVLLWDSMGIAEYIPAFTLYSHQTELFVAFHAPIFVFLLKLDSYLSWARRTLFWLFRRLNWVTCFGMTLPESQQVYL